jgi:predicted nuclease of predicted toxin-antitoxin system
VRLVLDEHLASAIAVELRRRGHDVLAVTEDADLQGLADEELLAWAATADRVVVTYDVRDYRRLVDEWQTLERPFAGVLLLSSRRYRQGRPAPLIRDLVRLLEADLPPDALRGLSRWLGSE